MALLHCGMVLLAASSSLLAPAHNAPMQRLQRAHAPVQFTAQQTEFYLTAEQIAYIRPGLNITVNSVTVAADGKVVADISFADDGGQPLDRQGVLTPGPLSISFLLARYDAENVDFVSYATRKQTSPITGVTATQANTDSGGTWDDLALGHATYTFKTVLPAGDDASQTHTVGIYATRVINLTDPIVVNKTYVFNTTYNFRPDGQAVTAVWDATSFATCNQCHDPLAAHGETGREDPRVCVICHNDTQSLDPDTGNVVNFKVMIHKIHMGENLPSVKAGHPYQIIGFRQSVADFSDVVFPQDVRNCTTCHKSPDPAGKIVADADIYMTKPNRAACGSCHDNINWETGEGHVAGPQLDDSACASCHIPQGESEFDASITGAHTIPTKSAQLAGLNMQILSVTNAAPGSAPTVTFKITNNDGSAVDPSKLTRFNIILGGPTTDYTTTFRESATRATCAGDGTCTYAFTTPIPADATGSWTATADYYRNVIIDNHTETGLSVREAGQNPIFYFPVTDAQAMARREVVDIAKCNVCHNVLAFHGGQRYQVKECVICHNPTATASVPDQNDQSIHFKFMIHRIHTGENLEQNYSIGNTNFNGILFPGDRRDCQKCHLAGTYTVPLPDGVLPTITPSDYYSPMQPTAAACMSCHDAQDAEAHAYTMTTAFGEACEVCHGNDAQFSVDKVHAR
ncbi:MAG: OmcA/MtrC family decaheme c-type cytochrome [Acidobacteriota bacterium]